MTEEQTTELPPITDEEREENKRVEMIADLIGTIFGTFDVEFATGAAALTVALVRAAQTFFNVDKEGFLDMVSKQWDAFAIEKKTKNEKTLDELKEQIISALTGQGLKVVAVGKNPVGAVGGAAPSV